MSESKKTFETNNITYLFKPKEWSWKKPNRRRDATRWLEIDWSKEKYRSKKKIDKTS
jgi:hypothetical protein